MHACTTFGLCLFPGVFLSSRVTGACPVTTDLIMRFDVRTTTTTAAINNSRNISSNKKESPWVKQDLVYTLNEDSGTAAAMRAYYCTLYSWSSL